MSQTLAVSVLYRIRCITTALQSFRNTIALCQISILFPTLSFRLLHKPLGFPGWKQMSLSDLTNPASSPAIKRHSFTQTTMTEHEEAMRWQRSSPLLTTVSFGQINFVLEHNVLNDTGCVPVGKTPPSPQPHDNLLKLCTALSARRLQAPARREAAGSCAQGTSPSDADRSSAGRRGGK